MAKTINKLVAEALSEVSKNANGHIVHSKNIKPKQQALLVKQGYLKRIIKGWYLFDADLSAQQAGESALWYESVWSFIGQYLVSRFKDNYWLSAEASLDVHTHNNAMPTQLVVYVKNGTEDIVQLPNNMSLLVTNVKTKPGDLIRHRGVAIFPLETALANSVPMAFRKHPVSLQVALRSAKLDKLAEALLRSKNVASAGRIIGAYDALGMRAVSKKLEAIIGSAFGNIKVNDPFLVPPVILGTGKIENASARRIRIIWTQMRTEVIVGFSSIKPAFDFHSRSLDETLASIDDIYVHDAYHSLSIEGYAVTPELIEKVSRGDWSPETITEDNDAKNVLAARGYYDAFNQVKRSLTQAYNKEDFDYLIDVGITQWHTSMFKPCVTAGIISEIDLAGYRKGPIYIRASRHVPPASEQLMDCMDALKECMAEEESFAVKAVLGHFIFGYIHPYFDGNGRAARFLMNFIFVVGGYNWVIVTKEARVKYLNALESASVGKDIRPFVEFIISMIESK
jgi:Fic family protein